jgi:ATP phosphoribosyltransferase regulatory subunit
LRLAYAGQVVRRTNSEHRPQRQSGQIGLELIGAYSSAADAEIIRLGCASLLAVGIADFTLDLTLPTLVGGICQAYDLPSVQIAALRQALDRKDREAVAMTETPATPLLLQLLQLGGPMDAALAGLQALDLPGSVKAECDHLAAVWNLIKAEAFASRIMLDLVERRGFEYNTGLGYTLFANQPGIELGRGGRYHSKARDSVEPGEPATGFTFYSENLLAAMPEPQPTLRLYLPYGTAAAQAASYHQKGFVTIAALQPETDPAAAARAQGCTHHLHNGHPEKL